MIRRLEKGLHIPANLLIQEYQLRSNPNMETSLAGSLAAG